MTPIVCSIELIHKEVKHILLFFYPSPTLFLILRSLNITATPEGVKS